MAVIKDPDLGMISRLGRDLDFYYWKGLPCVRTYPRRIKQPGTEEQIKTWDAMRFASAAWRSLPEEDKDAWKRLCVPPERTGRDFFLRIILSGKAKPGSVYNELVADFRPPPPGQVILRINKAAATTVLISVMREEERKKLLIWSEGQKCLRGKRWRRRFNFHDGTERANEIYVLKPPFTWKDILGVKGDGRIFCTAKVKEPGSKEFGRLGLFDLRYGYG